jgi:hypothetical protein
MSRESVLKAIYEHNLVTYYLLPLLGINQFNFGQDNFVNAFVDVAGDKLYVHVKDLYYIEDPYHSQWYHSTITVEGKNMIVFELPIKWKNTFTLFREGKYSLFTKAAKSTIIRNSGLRWKVETVDEETNMPLTMSDARLLALNRTDSLIKALAEDLNVDPVMLRDQELISPPKDSEFIKVIL